MRLEEPREKLRKPRLIAEADDEMSDAGSEASEITLDSEESDSMTMGSFVKVDDAQKTPHDVSLSTKICSKLY